MGLIRGSYDSKTVVLKRAAPKVYDILLCFGLHFIRQRVGGIALAVTLSAKLGIVNSTGRSVQRFDEAILRRVFGRRLMDAVARSASDEMSRLLAARPPCPFMVSMQVIRECFAATDVFFFPTVYLCRLMRGKESTNGEYFVMLLLMSKTFPTRNSLNSFYLPIQLLLTRNKGNGTVIVLSCAAFIF